MKRIIKLSQGMILLLVIFCVLSNSSFGAEVTRVLDDDGSLRLDVSGEIIEGDLNKIKKASAKLILDLGKDQGRNLGQTLHFHLDTGGGDVREAIKIGRFAREILASIDTSGKIIAASGSATERVFIKESEIPDTDVVIVSPNMTLTEEHMTRNYSAGILIFYGAVKRSSSDNVDRRLGFDRQYFFPVVGLHRPYYDKEYFSELSPLQAAKAYRSLEKEVREYLLEMGAPQSLLDRMFRHASVTIDLVPDEEFRKLYKEEGIILKRMAHS